MMKTLTIIIAAVLLTSCHHLTTDEHNAMIREFVRSTEPYRYQAPGGPQTRTYVTGGRHVTCTTSYGTTICN